MTQNDSLPPVEGPEYTPCACSHIESQHGINGRWCAMDDCPCSLYRPKPATVAPPADRAGLRQRIAEAALSAVEAALDDTLVPAAREKALAGIAAVLPAPDQQTDVLREAAAWFEDRYVTRFFGHQVAAELRRLAGETQQDRCPSCDHKAEYHDVDNRCWFTVDHGVAGSNLGCPCAPRRDDDDAQQDETCETGDMRTCTGSCPAHGELPEQQPARVAQQDPAPGGEFVPPAAEGLPCGALDSARTGATMLDAFAETPNGRNFLAHALVQLARDGWLRTEPGEGFEPVRDPVDVPEPQDPADMDARLRCPQCGKDITDWAEADFVHRAGDERPYCSDACAPTAPVRSGQPDTNQETRA